MNQYQDIYLGLESSEPLKQIAAGVFGWAIDRRKLVYIPRLEAENEGSGQVGKFLDTMPTNYRIANVISQRLRGMLKRRGFIREFENGVDVWRRNA